MLYVTIDLGKDEENNLQFTMSYTSNVKVALLTKDPVPIEGKWPRPSTSDQLFNVA